MEEGLYKKKFMRRGNQTTTYTVEQEVNKLNTIRTQQIDVNPPSPTFPTGPGHILGGTPLPELIASRNADSKRRVL